MVQGSSASASYRWGRPAGIASAWPACTWCTPDGSVQVPRPAAHTITMCCAAPFVRARPWVDARGKYPTSVTSSCDSGGVASGLRDERAREHAHALTGEAFPPAGLRLRRLRSSIRPCVSGECPFCSMAAGT